MKYFIDTNDKIDNPDVLSFGYSIPFVYDQDSFDKSAEFYVIREHDTDLITYARKNHKPFMIYKTATRWLDLHEFVALGASYVLIGEELLFSLPKVKEMYDDIKFVAYANICQCRGCGVSAPYTAFIPPKFMYMYADYLYGIYILKPKDTVSVAPIVDEYINDTGVLDLEEFIINLDAPIKQDTLLPAAWAYRLTCGQKCVKGGSCKICERMYHLGLTIDKKNLRFGR